LGERILVVPIRDSETTQSDLCLAGADSKPAIRGKIVGIGTASCITGTFQIGEYVIFQPYTGEELVTDDGKFTLLNRDDILAKIQ